MLIFQTIFEFLSKIFRDLGATKTVIVSKPFDDNGCWTIVHGTPDHIRLRRFKDYEDAANEKSAVEAALRMGTGMISVQVCEVDVAGALRLSAKMAAAPVIRF